MAADGSPSFVFLPGLAAAEGTFAIAGDEGHYLSRVVRVRAGEQLRATDGAGTVATLEVIEPGTEVRVRLLAREAVERRLALELWCGAPEGDRADWMVEKLAELGVARLLPVDGARGRWERAGKRQERWERLATAALRQSRSVWRLDVAAPVPLAAALTGAAGAETRWICRPDGEAAVGLLHPRAPSGRVIVAVGPSSGFAEDELNALRDNGFTGVSLAASRLRTETAALAAASLWAAADAAATGGGPGRR